MTSGRADVAPASDPAGPVDAAAIPGPASLFDPPALKAGHTRRGGLVAIGGQGVKTAVRLVGTVVLARLLTPEDFGLVAMVTVATGFVGMFTDVGLSAATVQRPTVTHAQVSTLFWLNVALGGLLAAATAAAAPLLAAFYREPRLAWMTVALSGTFLLAGLTVQHQALLRRRMRFYTVTAITVGSQALGTATALGASWAGWGPWSLVAMSLAGGCSTMILCWLCSGWVPGRPVRRSGVRGLLAFGGGVSAATAVNYLFRNLDNLLIGAVWGPRELGLYSRAYSLVLLPLSQVQYPMNGIALPALSRLQDDPDGFRAEFLALYRSVCGPALPIATVAAVLSGDAVAVLLGPQWADAVPVFRILAVATLLQPLWGATGWLFVPLGRVREQFRCQLVMVLLVLPGWLLGLPYGATGVAAGFAVTLPLGLLATLVRATRTTPVSFRDLLVAPTPDAAVALLAAAAAFAAARGVDAAGPLWSLAAGGAAAAAVTVPGLLVTRNPLLTRLGA